MWLSIALELSKVFKSKWLIFGREFFRCSLPKAMSISRNEILRKKEEKRPENVKSHVRSWSSMGGHRSLVEGHGRLVMGSGRKSDV